MHRVVGNARFSKPKEWNAKLAVSEAEHAVETVKWLFNAVPSASMAAYAFWLVVRGESPRQILAEGCHFQHARDELEQL